ncbi:MAG: hypothetical protein ACJ75J_05155, partial [Cytophagaceae bacterium]
MKKHSLLFNIFAFLLAGGALFSSCKSSGNESANSTVTPDSNTAASTGQTTPAPEESRAICIWDKASLLDKP